MVEINFKSSDEERREEGWDLAPIIVFAICCAIVILGAPLFFYLTTMD